MIILSDKLTISIDRIHSIDISRALDHHIFMKIALKLILFIALLSPIFSEILISTSKDNLDWVVQFSNETDELYEAMVISADPDYQSEIGQISIKPNESVVLHFLYKGSDSKDDDPVYIRLISDHKKNPGLVTLGEKTESTEMNVNEEGLLIEYFYTPTCSSCRDFLEKEIPLIETKLNISIQINNIDITEPDGLIQMNKRLTELGSTEKKLPMIIAGNQVLAGDRVIEDRLEVLLQEISKEGYETNKKIGTTDDRGLISLKILPILFAGLLDGINPCAFSTLIFLLSWLTLAGRNKKDILLTGIFFTTTVFITYYTIGLGAFTALRTSESVPAISWVLKYAMSLILLVLGIIHIFDYRKVKQGRSNEMTLQLSKERKKKIHSLIRVKARQTGLFIGSIALGLLVTIYELGCTGQVYLPTLMYMITIEKGLSAFLMLGVYNFGFILPLIVIFIAAWRGLGSEKLTIWFKDHLAMVKMLSAIFFLLMAVLLILV